MPIHPFMHTTLHAGHHSAVCPSTGHLPLPQAPHPTRQAPIFTPARPPSLTAHPRLGAPLKLHLLRLELRGAHQPGKAQHSDEGLCGAGRWEGKGWHGKAAAGEQLAPPLPSSPRPAAATPARTPGKPPPHVELGVALVEGEPAAEALGGLHTTGEARTQAAAAERERLWRRWWPERLAVTAAATYRRRLPHHSTICLPPMPAPQRTCGGSSPASTPATVSCCCALDRPFMISRDSATKSSQLPLKGMPAAVGRCRAWAAPWRRQRGRARRQPRRPTATHLPAACS